MHAALFALTIVAMSASPAATPSALAPLPHLRPLDPLAVDLVSAGTRRSSTFAQLLATLDRASGLVVYVTTTPAPEQRGSIVFVSRASGVTYLLIRVNTRQIDLDRVSVLAHELAHAVEISRASPPITSDRELQRLYTCIGVDASGHRLESEAAIRAERAVHHEIGKVPAR
ncbi:MAG TPA: hypothetical protein VJN96_19085 [Vicinamibacterales bacterium]|nr:hypothetical protein [Vicinamibacterales bacterium]